MVGVFWIASSVTQPVFGALGEDIGLRVIGCMGVLMASTFLSLIGVASELWLVFVLLVIGGLGSAALPRRDDDRQRAGVECSLGVGLFTAGGMVGFALGPVLILYLCSTYGSDATVWLAVPNLILGVVWAFSPQWEPHPRRPLRRLFDLRLLRGPVGLLAVAGMFSALAFVTFTGSHPDLARARKCVLTRRVHHRDGRSAFASEGGLGQSSAAFSRPGSAPSSRSSRRSC